MNYEPPTDPEQLTIWEDMRNQLKRWHKCQCTQCVAKALNRAATKIDPPFLCYVDGQWEWTKAI